MDNMVFIAWDGDDIGQKVGQAILADSPEQLDEASHNIDAANEVFANWANSVGGVRYSLGGDQGVFAIPAEAVEDLESIKKDYEYVAKATVTIGVGRSLSESGKALVAGKARGKNQIVMYDDSVEQDLSQNSNDLENQSEGNMEHKEECPYCNEAADPSNHADDCPYCQEMDNEENHSSEDHNHDDCPYCQLTAKASDDCPHCKEYDAKKNSESGVEADAGPTTELPTTTDSQDFAGQDLNPPAIPKPGVNPDPMPVAPAKDEETVNNRMLEMADQENGGDGHIEGSSEKGSESPEDVLEALVGEGSDPNQLDSKAINQDVDDTALAIGTNMEDNVSRPDDFQSDVPSSMGIAEEGDSNTDISEEAKDKSPEEEFGETLGEESEEEPEYSDLMGEDLDNHAKQQQKQQVVQLVSEALEGFKQCKDILERAKEQAPQLYTSSIAMLRAMIEMSNMLELASAAPSMNEEQPQEMPAEQAQEEKSPEQEFSEKIGEEPNQEEKNKAPGVAQQSPKL